LSWGGSVAAIVAGRDARVKAAVLWNAALPAFDWRPPLREVDGRLVVELFGNLIGEQFYQQARGLHVAEELRTVGCPFLVVQSSNDEVGTEGERRQFRGILAACRIPFAWHTIQGADHALMRHDWEREAIQVSVEWLGKSLSVPSP
jgi:pimeloyl-ACP methyl ester carboxylesterase